jgi:DNA polymerase III delta prime subunit
MNTLNINNLLNREKEVIKIKQMLNEFENNKNNTMTKRGLYIYGDPGSGKTTFVTNILNELNYDVIRYDAGDIRNKTIIDTITNHNMADKNIMSMFHKKIKKIAIIMDEIDGMNNGDKGGINSLIKIIRPKKTKKQRTEESTLNIIICIGNYHMDKKIKELMKVCNTIELKMPTKPQITTIVYNLIPSFVSLDETIKEKIICFIQGDLRKLNVIYNLFLNDSNPNEKLINGDTLKHVFLTKSYNDNTKQITKKLINSNSEFNEHSTLMNETDRTIVGLLWHENIIDVFGKTDKSISIPFYLKALDNMCFADYIDRVTFQKQIWQFNEMSSLIKTFKNNKEYHDTFIKKQMFNPNEVRFTKVLTKYSTEYNNYIFIQNLCQELLMDKNDLFAFFLDLKTKYNDTEMVTLFENYNISKLDINRVYRYLEKYTTENACENENINDCDDTVSDVGYDY